MKRFNQIWRNILKKHVFVKLTLGLIVCMCIAGTTLFVALHSSKAAHASQAVVGNCDNPTAFRPGSTFNQGQNYTVTTCMGNQLTLIMQWDDNLVLYCNSTAMWASGTWSPNPAGAYATFQTDGNFVVYAQYDDAPTIWHPVWASNTWHEGGQYLVLQSDGNLVMYQYQKAGSAIPLYLNPIWATNTGGEC